LVTGASGFIGRQLCATLAGAGWRVRAAERRPDAQPGLAPPAERTFVGDIGPSTEWGNALEGVQAAVHLAGRVHVMRERAADPLAEFRRTNVEGTRQLAHACARAGVRRLVFVSSIKVNGEETSGRPYTEVDPAAPTDPYGVSKWEAETALSEIGRREGLEVVVVRPPLVYGPGVGGNLLRLLGLVARGVPLPLAAVRNLRSLLGRENLCDLLRTCLEHQAAAGETFLASDDHDLSTTELIRQLARGLGRPAHLFEVPQRLLGLVLGACGQGAAFQRLFGSLQVDGSKACRLLAWSPPVAVEIGLAEMAAWYRGVAGSR
jgi:nucleoside-diphosphate-sugar epimerase